MKDIYQNIKKNGINIAPQRELIDKTELIDIRFRKGCSVNIDGNNPKEYKVLFKENGQLLYSTLIKNNQWSKINKRFFGNYSVEVFCEGKLIKKEELNLKNKNVRISIDSEALGDSIAWIAQVDKFQRAHKCNVYVHCPFKDLFKSEYPNLNFDNQYEEDIYLPGYYASYSLGYFYDKNWMNNTPTNPKTIPLAKTASEILGLPYEELKPKISIDNKARKHDKPYVCIATQSTAQCKYWNNKEGWERVCEYLKSKGLDVICIDKHESFGVENYMNFIPKNAINKTGDFPLQERITDIHNCEFFIGLGSGLSWLAWALNKPVVLISGFSNPISEFKTPYRVFNEKVCNSCWNDLSESFNGSSWSWCPKGKNFECSSQITPEMVIEKINLLV